MLYSYSVTLHSFPLSLSPFFQVSRPVPRVSVLVSFEAKSARRRSPFVSKTNDFSFSPFFRSPSRIGPMEASGGPGGTRASLGETRTRLNKPKQDQMRTKQDQIEKRESHSCSKRMENGKKARETWILQKRLEKTRTRLGNTRRLNKTRED